MAETTETQESPGRLVSVPEAARRCAVSKPHMYRLVSAGVVPAPRVGQGAGPIRIDEAELESWLYGGEAA